MSLRFLIAFYSLTCLCQCFTAETVDVAVERQRSWVYVVSPAETSSFRSVAVLLVQQNVCPEAESLLLTDFRKESLNKVVSIRTTVMVWKVKETTASFKKRINHSNTQFNVLMDTLSLFTAGLSLLSVQIPCGLAEGALQIYYHFDLLLPYWLFTN